MEQKGILKIGAIFANDSNKDLQVNIDGNKCSAWKIMQSIFEDWKSCKSDENSI